MVISGWIEALRTSDCVRHACLEIGEPKTVLSVFRHPSRQPAQDGSGVTKGRCAVLTVQQQPQLEAGIGYHEPDVQLLGKSYGRHEIKLVRVDNTPYLVELVPTLRRNRTGVTDKVFRCPNPDLELNLDGRVAQMSLQPAEISRFSALTTADNEQTQPWLTKRRAPTRAGRSISHQLLGLFNRRWRDKAIEPIEDRYRSVCATEVAASDIVLVSWLEIGERV